MAVDSRKNFFAMHPLQRVSYGIAIRGRTTIPAGPESLRQHACVDEWADGVVDCHKALGGEGGKPGSNGVGTRLTSGHDA